MSRFSYSPCFHWVFLVLLFGWDFCSFGMYISPTWFHWSDFSMIQFHFSPAHPGHFFCDGGTVKLVITLLWALDCSFRFTRLSLLSNIHTPYPRCHWIMLLSQSQHGPPCNTCKSKKKNRWMPCYQAPHDGWKSSQGLARFSHLSSQFTGQKSLRVQILLRDIQKPVLLQHLCNSVHPTS